MYKILAKNKKGFTLIELIVVIAILAILAAIAIPTFSGITDEAYVKVDLANARTLATAINAHNNLNPDDADQITSIDVSTIVSDLGNLYPSGIDPDDLTRLSGMITFNDSVAVAAEPTATEAPA